MPFVKHSLAARAEAVALAAVLGLSAAADQLGIDEKTLRSWMLKAGKDPADAIKPASWSRLADMALTKAERLVAEGKLSPAQLANLATMAEERAAKSDERRKSSEPAAIDAAEAFWDWLLARQLDEPLPASVVDEASLNEYMDALNAATGEVRGELLRRANREEGQPHRAALLAWASGRPEIEAGDILEWSQAQVVDLGDLVTWHAKVRAAAIRDVAIRKWTHTFRESGVAYPDALAVAVQMADVDYPDPWETAA
jgi:hypothetical protein